ncbi:VCBS repeat-containing protein [Candidatus Magnetobacterium casense]|uniref:VCBS repeat-containing protein n=1 Tax=Candidatus Magnetobacterium casense TaxID=1455061 RepID=UPI00058FEB86|nr:VCBS repeat-containing protein [Candidatus Magnetobacterium casensis]
MTVTKQGTGDGTITTSTGSLNWSGNIGSALYALNTQVIVTAVTDNSSMFSGWTGCDVNIGNQCTVNMTATRSITAEFNGVCKRTKKDFDGDGKSDILWQNSNNGDVAIWLMNGASKKSAAFAANGVPKNWRVIASDDFNGDGKADIIWQNTDTGDVYVWLMDGTKPNSGDYVYRSMTSEWQIKAIGDFNGDCRNDVLWQNTSTNDVVVWLLDGVKIKSRDFIVKGVPADWEVRGVGDFNGDGKTDILWQSKDTGDVYAWLMDGVKIQGSSGFVAKGIPHQWQIRSIADYDGDGKSDVHLQDVDTGKIYVWLMDGIKIKGGDFVKPKGGAGQSMGGSVRGSGGDTWAVKSVGDYNGDGMNDMLWQDGSTGDVYIWFMDGTTINSGGYADQGVPSDWGIY